MLRHGMLQGFRRGHSGLVALKAVATALIMLYTQSQSGLPWLLVHGRPFLDPGPFRSVS